MNKAESALHGFSSSIASAWNTLSQFGSNRGSSDSVTGGADSTMSAQDSDDGQPYAQRSGKLCEGA